MNPAQLSVFLSALGLQTNGWHGTWATRPSAVGRLHDIIHIDDIGPNGAGSFWYSDGARWRPVNHYTTLYNLAAPATTGGSIAEISLAAVRIPAGALANGDILICTQVFSKTNTIYAATLKMVMTTSPSDATTGQIVLVPASTFSATGRAFAMKREMQRVSATSVTNSGLNSSAPFVGVGVGTLAAAATGVADMDTTDNYLHISATSGNAAETVTLSQLNVELMSCGS